MYHKAVQLLEQLTVTTAPGSTRAIVVLLFNQLVRVVALRFGRLLAPRRRRGRASRLRNGRRGKVSRGRIQSRIR